MNTDDQVRNDSQHVAPRINELRRGAGLSQPTPTPAGMKERALVETNARCAN